jgi:sugar phosphate isomerase/epimerase
MSRLRLGSRLTAKQPPAEYLTNATHHFQVVELPTEPRQLSPYFSYTASQKKTLQIYKKRYQFQLTMHAPFVDLHLGSPEPEKRHLSLIKMLTTMQLAADLEIQCLTFHPCPLELEAPECYAENCCYEEDSLASLLPVAQRLGINLLLKNMPLKPKYHPSTRDGSRMLKLLWLFPEPHFGLTIDLGHALQAKVPIDSLLNLKRVRHFHLHEYDRQGGSYLPISTNLVWWRQILARLDKEFPDAAAILDMDRFSDQLCSLRNLIS